MGMMQPEGRTLRHSASAHPLLGNRVDPSWNNISNQASPLSAGPRLEDRLSLRPPLPDLGTCYGRSLDGHPQSQHPPLHQPSPSASTPPMTLPLVSMLPRSVTPGPQITRSMLGSGHIQAQMMMNQGPSPQDQPLAQDAMLSMNQHSQDPLLGGSPSWNSATRGLAEGVMDYPMDLTAIGQGPHQVDSPLHSLAQTAPVVPRPHSASPLPPPTPVSAITIPVVYDPLQVGQDPSNLAHSLSTHYLGMQSMHPQQPPQQAQVVEAVGLPPAQAGVLSNMPSTSMVDHLGLGLPPVSGPTGGMVEMTTMDGRPTAVSSYRRSTYPLPPQQQLPQHAHHHTLGQTEMMHMGAEGMGWQGVLLPIKAESPPTHQPMD
jgi:hypothetical protein